jgi:hypothetical protein
MMRQTKTLLGAAFAAVILQGGGAGSTLGHGGLRELTLESASASITWNGDDPAAPRRVRKRDINASLQRIASDRDGTYIDEILSGRDSALSRWPDRTKRAIRVWISPDTSLQGSADKLYGEVQSAFFEWERTGIPVRFGFVADSAESEVRVFWTDSFDTPISGSAVWARDKNWWIVDGSVTIARFGSSGNRLSNTAVRAIALHEVGHLLGLDHTADTMSVMAARVRVKAPSEADRATMRLLYSLQAGPLRR